VPPPTDPGAGRGSTPDADPDPPATDGGNRRGAGAGAAEPPPHELSLSFDYPDAATAALVRESVVLEAGEIEGDRTRATVGRDGTTVRIGIVAADPVALRAGLNTWCTLVDVAERVLAIDDTDQRR